MRFEKAAIVGVGLIGGSFGLALKAAGACSRVVGLGRGRQNLQKALERGAIDAVAEDVSDCDLILIATPVGQFGPVFEKLRIHDQAVLTDGGSTKRDVIAAARRALGPRIRQFVPAHPIAGSEQGGAEAARADLFRGRRVILTPLPENDEASIQKIRQAWEACGAKVSTMDAQEHDSVLSTVSHLPHLLAYALAQEVAGRADSKRLFEIAGAGFRDFTRLASSGPEMWRDICLANRDMLLQDLEKFSGKLDFIKSTLERGDAAALQKIFEEARAARDQWKNSSS